MNLTPFSARRRARLCGLSSGLMPAQPVPRPIQTSHKERAQRCRWALSGTGSSQTFNDVAEAVLKFHGRGKIEYIPFPEHLRGRYQSFTEADLTRLRRAGYRDAFLSVEEGVERYLASLEGSATPEAQTGDS